MIARSPCDVGVIESRRGGSPTDGVRGGWVLAATVLGSSMVFIDGSAVNIVLPVLQSDLHATAIELQWVVVGYSLFLSSLMLAGGALGDRLGRRRVFVAGAIAFAAASAICGIAHDARTLVTARAMQGVGSALLTPGSLALIGATFRDARRAAAIATWSSVTAITAAIGPGLGGWLAEHLSWRWVFYINVPIAIVVVVIALLHVPESSDGKPASGIDWWGAFLCTVGLGGIVFALTFASAIGWGAPSVIAGLVLGSFALAMFVVVEARAADPMLPLSLFSSKTFAGVNILTFLLYAALAAAMYFLPFRMIQVDGYSPTAAGFSLLPFVILIFSLSRVAGGLVTTIGPRPLLVAGPLTAAAACVMLAYVGDARDYWQTYFPAIVVLGLGMAATVAPLTATVMQSVDVARVGVASGVNNAVSRIAGLIAVAGLGSLMLAAFSHGLDLRLDAAGAPAPLHQAVVAGRLALAQTPVPADAGTAMRAAIQAAILASYLGAFRFVMLACAALAAAGAAVAAITIGRRRG